MLTVKPAKPGMIIRMPEKQNQPLPANGDTVPANSYWQRRLRDGDVIKTSPRTNTKAEK